MLNIPKNAFRTLLRFSQLVSDTSEPEKILDLMGRILVEECEVPCVLVFEIDAEGEMRLLTRRGGEEPGAPAPAAGNGPVDVRTLAESACGGRFTAYRSFSLISDTGLFGSLVVLYAEERPLAEWQWEIVEEIAQLTAIGLNKTFQYQRLSRAYDELQASHDLLARTERLRSLGQMSASISHDIKNILLPLSLQADFIARVAHDKEAVLKHAAKLKQNIAVGIDILERLRDFSRQSPDTTAVEPADLNGLAREAFELCRPRAAPGVTMSLALASPPRVHLRASECISAVVNLVGNALDALAGKGAITVSTGSGDGGGWLEVRDTGPGIPRDLQARILEPFFTTKGEKGTGLGLSMVYALAKRHHGRLSIDSEPGKGAAFRLWFPVERAHAPAPLASRQ